MPDWKKLGSWLLKKAIAWGLTKAETKVVPIATRRKPRKR